MRRALSLSLLLALLWPGLALAATLTLTWQDNATNEDSTRIERAPATSGPWAEVDAVGPDVTTYADTTAPAGTVSCYRVRARNAAGDSAYSNTACATPAALAMITVSPALQWAGIVGGPTPAPIVATITTSNGAAWASADTCPWVNAAPTSGASGGTQTWTLDADYTALPAGIHTCQVTYTAPGATPLVVTITAVKIGLPTTPSNLQVVP